MEKSTCRVYIHYQLARRLSIPTPRKMTAPDHPQPPLLSRVMEEEEGVSQVHVRSGL
jgi:hypothetical protein